MKRLIYLEDAIDAINELHDKPNAWLDLAVDSIENLPYAQTEIIYCKDCKYFDPLNEDVDYNFCDAWAGGTNEDMFCGFAERRQDATD